MTAIVAVSLACAAPAAGESGMGFVSRQAMSELQRDVVKIASAGEFQAVQTRVEILLAAPLDAAAAAQIALLYHPGLQEEYYTLALAEGTPARPDSLASASPGSESEQAFRTRQLPDEPELHLATLRALEATFRTDADARRAFYRAVAARQRVGLLLRARDAAGIAVELTRKQRETGAATQLMQARAALLEAEFSAEVLRARLEAEAAREQLIRALGLETGPTTLLLPERLPDLPEALTAIDAEKEAFARRVDLMGVRLGRDVVAMSLGIAGAESANAGEERSAAFSRVDRANGQEIRLSQSNDHAGEPAEEPQAGAVAPDAQRYLAAANRAAALGSAARSEAREAQARYRAAYEIALIYQNRVAPLRQAIDEETLLKYNGMLVDVLDLLAATRESISAAIAATDAQRDFFIAEVDFQTAIIGGVGNGGSMTAAGPGPASEAPGDH